MDKQLAEFYGTGSTEAEELEKMASAELAEALAEEGDFDGLTDEDLEAAAMEILEDGEEVEKVAMEKIAEDYDHADRMGRIMAHAYVQELGEIEKTAFSVTDAGHRVDAKEYGAISKMHNERARANEEYTKENPLLGHLTGRSASGALHRLADRHMDYAAKKHEDRRNAFNPFGGMLTKSRNEAKEKNSSAFGTLVEARAAEILEANGIDPETFEKVAEGNPHAETTGLNRVRNAVKNTSALAWHKMKEHPKKSIAGGVLAAGGIGYGAKKMYDKRKEKRSSVDPEVLAGAVEGNAIALLEELGFEFE